MAWKWRKRPQRAGHFIKSFYHASRRAQYQAFFKPPAGRSKPGDELRLPPPSP